MALLSRRRKAYSGDLNIMGLRGHVDSALDPNGAIILNGELWRAQVAQSSLFVLSGKMVRVIGINGIFLVVEPAE